MTMRYFSNFTSFSEILDRFNAIELPLNIIQYHPNFTGIIFSCSETRLGGKTMTFRNFGNKLHPNQDLHFVYSIDIIYLNCNVQDNCIIIKFNKKMFAVYVSTIENTDCYTVLAVCELSK